MNCGGRQNYNNYLLSHLLPQYLAKIECSHTQVCSNIIKIEMMQNPLVTVNVYRDVFCDVHISMQCADYITTYVFPEYVYLIRIMNYSAVMTHCLIPCQMFFFLK